MLKNHHISKNESFIINIAGFSENPNLTVDMILKPSIYIHNKLYTFFYNWDRFYKNPGLSVEDLLKIPYIKINPYILSQNPNLTIQHIDNCVKENWDWSKISNYSGKYNKFVYRKHINHYITNNKYIIQQISNYIIIY